MLIATEVAARFSRTYATRLVPGIGTTSNGCANSQAKASCPGRHPLSAASLARAATGSRLVARLSAENRGLLARKSLESNGSPGFSPPVSADRPNGLNGTNVMPSSRHVAVIAPSTRRSHSEYSLWERREIGRGTRLNSSHLGISYAVFCLKKKKKI